MSAASAWIAKAQRGGRGVTWRQRRHIHKTEEPTQTAAGAGGRDAQRGNIVPSGLVRSKDRSLMDNGGMKSGAPSGWVPWLHAHETKSACQGGHRKVAEAPEGSGRGAASRGVAQLPSTRQERRGDGLTGRLTGRGRRRCLPDPSSRACTRRRRARTSCTAASRPVMCHMCHRQRGDCRESEGGDPTEAGLDPRAGTCRDKPGHAGTRCSAGGQWRGRRMVAHRTAISPPARRRWTT